MHRVLTRFSTAFQKSGRVPDFFWFSKAIFGGADVAAIPPLD
jgi:hypothetical protein